MKIQTNRKYILGGVFALTLSILNANVSVASGIDVPGDFPGTFTMDLLTGNAYWDFYGVQSCTYNCTGFSLAIDTTKKNIQFDATAFDGVGAGNGASQLTLNPINNWLIGTGTFFNEQVSIYVDGAGTGTLVDNATSTAGDWTLDVPMYALWNGVRFDFSDLTLSTAASYSYIDEAGAVQQLSGSIMDYATGDTYFVGQSIITDPNHPFYGLKMTMGFYGNDPLVAATPIPAAVWLFGTGLIALTGFARRKANIRSI